MDGKQMNDTAQFTNSYTDTRGLTEQPLTFTQAILEGIASGGGLFVPRILPQLSLDEIAAFAETSYSQLAAAIYKRFGVDLPSSVIEQLMSQSYGKNFDSDLVAPVVKVDEDSFVLELWHGPTSAFKDMALQCLPRFFSKAVEQLRLRGANSGSAGLDGVRDQNPSPADDYLILVATSGDTGKAALEGFKDREHTSIIVFYPDGGVSDIQHRQMTTQGGDNLGVFGVKGNFDDCQTAVKGAFSDNQFNQLLADRHQLRLSSANSINWGRLLPQIIYYVSAYAQMVGQGSLALGDELDVCVPTGNFGNILAAYYAKIIGVPIGQLLCASNQNRVLADFINTGVYDISERELKLTPSPSMDILVSSNLERQLFELTGRDATAIRGWMDDLKSKRRFQVDKTTFAALRQHFSADWVSDDDSLKTIREVYQQHNYLLDPHTAVAWEVAERLRGSNPVLVVATAHWAKFGADVYRALSGLSAATPLPDELAGLSGTALNQLLSAKYQAGRIPKALAELDGLPIRFTEVCDGNVTGIEQAVADWLAER
jgi:threonine synthase